MLYFYVVSTTWRVFSNTKKKHSYRSLGKMNFASKRITSIFKVKKKKIAVTNRNVGQVPLELPYWLSLLIRLTGYLPNVLLPWAAQK